MAFTPPKVVDIPHFTDGRCELGVIEASRQTGFDFRRIYYLYGNSDNSVRGRHCHKNLYQFMVCLNGSVRVHLENADGTFEFELSDPTKGILIAPGCWRELDQFAPETRVIVLASEEFDEDDYIRDYQDFKDWTAAPAGPVPYLALSRMHDSMRFEIERAVSKVLRSGNFIGGQYLTEFENSFAGYCHANYAIGCASGLDALVLILKALEIGAGDEVIVPANSFIASALAVSQVGATPVLVDVLPESYGIDPIAIKNAITPKTRAIMPVHLYGIPAAMDEVMGLATEHDLFVIEDAAQAHGATYRGRTIGSIGHAAAFSFYPTKNLGAAGDGGMVTTNDKDLAEKIRKLGNYGSIQKYHHDSLGVNSRLDPLQAAILSTKLPHLDEWNQKRRRHARTYQEQLAVVADITLPASPAHSVPVWHVFPIRVPADVRQECIAFLAKNGIGTNIHYPVPIHKQIAYSEFSHLQLPLSENTSNEMISLPLDAFHTNAEIDRVVAALKEFFRSA